MNRIPAHSATPSRPRETFDLPAVTVVIPTRNEARTLGRTLDSVTQQDYPRDLFEVLVVDAQSTDGTREIVYSHVDPGVKVSLLNNPGKSTAAAVNLALRSATADAFIWLSGHCILSPNYLTEAARAFAAGANRVTGGSLQVEGDGIQGKLNALVLSSPFGTGAAPHRFGREPGPTRSVTFSLFDRQTVIDLGGLDESLGRNQDNDLIARLKKRGVVFWRVASHATYLAPSGFIGLWKRAFLNGKWSVWSLARGRGGHAWWNFAPMAMVGGGAFLAVLSLTTVRWAGIALGLLAGIYFVLAFMSAADVAVRHRSCWAIPILPALFLAHHALYGVGSWAAVFRPNPVSRRRAARRENQEG